MVSLILPQNTVNFVIAHVGSLQALPLRPHSEVDWIGHACATCYGVVIPCFLALLFAKQHLTMRQCKTFIAQSDDKEEVTLQLQLLSTVESLKDRHVVATRIMMFWKFIGVVGVAMEEIDM